MNKKCIMRYFDNLKMSWFTSEIITYKESKALYKSLLNANEKLQYKRYTDFAIHSQQGGF